MINEIKIGDEVVDGIGEEGVVVWVSENSVGVWDGKEGWSVDLEDVKLKKYPA